MKDVLEALVAAAIRAPSGDNTQPWRFVMNLKSQCISVYLDESRDLSPMNSGQRMARIAMGAAVENVLQAARYVGWNAQFEPASSPALGHVHISGDGPIDWDKIGKVVATRVTNRRLYDAREIESSVLDQLKAATPPLESVHTSWITDRRRLKELAELVGRADAKMFGEPTMRNAFLANVRFDVPDHAEVEEGLSLASLEVGAVDRYGLRCMRRIPDRVLKSLGGLRVFARQAQRLIMSASGVCLIITSLADENTDLTVGRAMQRAWLALTRQGMAAQPMMSLPVLENALANGSEALVASLGQSTTESLLQAFRQWVPELGRRRVAFLLRFGYAPAPSGRTGRRALDACTELVDDTRYAGL